MLSVHSDYFLNFSKTIDQLDKGKPFLFVGAGVSLESGFPNWIGFTEKCVNLAFDNESSLSELASLHKVENYSIWLIEAAIQRLKQTNKFPDDPNNLKFFKSVLVPQDMPKPNTTHYLIVTYADIFNIPIFTTNYDPLLEIAAKELGITLNIHNQSSTNIEYEKCIVYLHGRLDLAEGLTPVAGQFSYYEEFNSDQNKAVLKLKDFLQAHSSLFIGCSLTDHNINRILYGAREAAKKAGVYHYWFTDNVPPSLYERKIFEEFWDVLQVKPVFCSSGNYAEITCFMRRLINKENQKKIEEYTIPKEQYDLLSSAYEEIKDKVAFQKCFGSFDSYDLDLYMDQTFSDEGIKLKRIWSSNRTFEKSKSPENERVFCVPYDLNDAFYTDKLSDSLVAVEESMDSLKIYYGVRNPFVEADKSLNSWVYVCYPVFSPKLARAEAVFVLKYLNKTNKLTEKIERNGLLNRTFERDIIKLKSVLEDVYSRWIQPKEGVKNE